MVLKRVLTFLIEVLCIFSEHVICLYVQYWIIIIRGSRDLYIFRLHDLKVSILGDIRENKRILEICYDYVRLSDLFEDGEIKLKWSRYSVLLCQFLNIRNEASFRQENRYFWSGRVINNISFAQKNHF
jgi:hypothetical protein